MYRGLSLRMHGERHGRALRPGMRLNHMNSQHGASNCHTVEEERKWLKDVMNELRGIYHRRGRPRGEERVWIPEVPAPLRIGVLQQRLVDNAGMGRG